MNKAYALAPEDLSFIHFDDVLEEIDEFEGSDLDDTVAVRAVTAAVGSIKPRTFDR